jgi:hypothetical protein
MNKLSVLEKHIYVKQGLQRQGAHKKDKQYNEAVDIALNKAQSRIIKDRLFPDPNIPFKFEINQKFASDIQSLIVTEKDLKIYTDGISKSYGELPYDFSYLLSDKSYVVEDCKAGFKDSTETKSERVIVIPFSSQKSATPYYNKIVASVNTSTKELTTPGFVTKEENVYLVDAVIDLYRQLGVVVYWETYKDITKPNCLLLVTDDLALTANIQVDELTATTSNIDNAVLRFKTSTGTGVVATNRDTKADFIDSALSSYYHKPIPTSPLSLLTRNRIVVYSTERFLVNRIVLNYIRKPKRISLSLNQGSELAASVHEEICDLAIQLIKKQIEDESYAKDFQDNKGRIE